MAVPSSIESRYSRTIQTHNSVSIAPSTLNNGSIWHSADGFNELSFTYQTDTSHSVSVNILWSNDGVNRQGSTRQVVNAVTASDGSGTTDVRAKYFRLELQNMDGALAHIMSAWVHLKP